MGGKQKQAQRTKGNVKPSSSGRSAALLNTSALAVFPGLKDTVFTFQTTSVSEELEATIDPNFQLVLKKMSKKDPTTRVKALQEFIKLVESCDIEILKAVLPFWPRLFCLLVADIDHRVREIANDAQRCVIVRAKRNMAPYLRSLAGPWFIAQFDTYPPASSAAIRSFQEAFPPNKLVEVISFCQEEILKFISDNLLDQESTKQDNCDRTEKQERVIITSLKGFCHYIRIVTDDLLSKECFLQVSEQLLKSRQFWKFGIDRIPLIRSAWLSVITSILEKVPHLLKDHHQMVVKRILGRLDETDAVVIPYIWQATLNILVKLDDWSAYCDMNKQVLPRVWCILREGGYGCAATIFPNMLPLLNSLLETKELQSDRNIIVDSFFKSLREGFDKKTVLQSKSESEAAAQCYIECVRFVRKCDIISTRHVLEYLIPVIESTLSESRLALLSKGMYEHISHLLRYWSSEKCVSQYEETYSSFWVAMQDLFSKVLLQASDDSNKDYILNQEVLFCSIMKDPHKFKNKSFHRVRFSPDNEQYELASQVEIQEVYSDDLCESEIHLEHLKKFVMFVSLYFLQNITEDHDLHCVIPLAKLLSEFTNHDLIEHLISKCNVSELFSTLSKKCFASSGQSVAIVVELACSMIQHLDHVEREEILNTVCQDPDTLVCIFQAAQKDKVKPYILQWLQSPYLNNKLISLTRDLCAGNPSNIKAVLMECAAKTSGGTFLVDLNTISSVLLEFSKMSSNSEIMSFAAQFLLNLKISLLRIEDLSSLTKLGSLSESTYKLIIVLFSLCCDESSMYNNSNKVLLSGWQSGIDILSKIKEEDIIMLVAELSGIIKNQLLTNLALSMDEVEYLVGIGMELLHSATKSNAPEDIYIQFVNSIFDEFNLLESEVMVHCENILTLLGVLHSNLKMELPHFTSTRISQYVTLSLYTSMIIMKIIPQELTHKDEAELSCPSNKSGSGLFIDNTNEFEVDFVFEEKSDCMKVSPVNEGKTDDLRYYDFLEQCTVRLALVVSTCEIYSSFFQSISFYHKAGLFIKELRCQYLKIKSALTKNGIIANCKQSTLEKASHCGGMWVPTVYNLSQEDDWLSIHKSLSSKSCAEYSAKMLFKKYFEISKNIPIENLGYSPSIGERTFWIKYMEIVPSETILTVIVGPIYEWLDVDREQLLYDCDISRKSLREIEEVVKKIYYLSSCVNKCPFIMEQKRVWDFIIISAAYYTQNLKYIQKFYVHSDDNDSILRAQTLECENTCKICIFSVAVFDLLSNIAVFCELVKKKEFSENYKFEDHANEWKNVFAEEVHLVLANIFISTAEYVEKEKPSLLGQLFLQKFCLLMMKINSDSNILDTFGELEQRMFISCCKLLHSSVTSLQITAYYIIKTFLSKLVEKDTSRLTINQDLEDESDQIKFEIYPLLKALQNTQTVVDTLLAEFSFGDSCIIQPHTDSYYYTAAYLLLWNLVLQACGFAGSELRYQYAALLRSEGYLSSLLNNLFFLMPCEVIENSLPKTKSIVVANWFSEPPELKMNRESTSQDLQHWACWMYYNTVSRLPALVRQWWSDTKAKVSSIVQRATVQYVTPLLCMRDLQAIQNQNTKWKNMEVKVHTKARQVVAVYTVDEQQMELVITLPEEYPLATIQVDTHTSSLVGTSQWRNWVKQLSIFLTHQNGSLWDGLLLWKSNLDKRFEGVEECYICFSILHGTNFQIPKLCCKTCKKKFHSPCLYKWFSTSNKSTCPICRNIF